VGGKRSSWERRREKPPKMRASKLLHAFWGRDAGVAGGVIVVIASLFGAGGRDGRVTRDRLKLATE
jgi:hypothetical protein